MIVDSIHFKGHTCFKNEWSGFHAIKPINVIIGRNNSGKSHLLDLVEALCSGELDGHRWKYLFRGTLDAASLQGYFKQSWSGGDLPGDHWDFHGRHFVGVRVTWQTDERGDVTDLELSSEAPPQTDETCRCRRLLTVNRTPAATPSAA